MLDYCYSEEFSILSWYGLSEEQQKLMQNQLYIDNGLTKAWDYAKDKWTNLCHTEMMNYEGSGYIQADITGMLSAETTDLYNDLSAYLRTATETVTYKFVTGELDALKDSDWATLTSLYDTVYKNGKTYLDVQNEVLQSFRAVVDNK